MWIWKETGHAPQEVELEWQEVEFTELQFKLFQMEYDYALVYKILVNGLNMKMFKQMKYIFL